MKSVKKIADMIQTQLTIWRNVTVEVLVERFFGIAYLQVWGDRLCALIQCTNETFWCSPRPPHRHLSLCAVRAETIARLRDKS